MRYKNTINILFTCFLLFFFSRLAAAEPCSSGSCFSKAINREGKDLFLVGSHTFNYLFIDVYSAAFYAAAPKTADVLSGEISKLLKLVYAVSIDREDFIKSADEVLKANPNINYSAIKDQLEQLNSVYEDVSAGDSYELLYNSSRGTTLSLNGRILITIPGESFANAYFGIWLSDYPIDKKMRAKLLGYK